MDEFYKNVYREFNAATVEIFSKLKHRNFDDILLPAKEVLNNESGDNGCAMYVAPIALICANNQALNLNDEIRKAAALTHFHEMAVDGAILQANSINVLIKSEQNLNIDDFLESILNLANLNSSKSSGPFKKQIHEIKKLLNVTNLSEERVINVLGHSSQALYSVPTAIYCFLRGVKYQSDVGLFSFLLNNYN